MWYLLFARNTCFLKTRNVYINLHVISALREHSVISPLCYRHWVLMPFPHWGNILSFPHYAIDIESPCHFHNEGTFRHFPTMLSTFSLHVISALREHSVISPLRYRHWVSMPFPHWGNILSFPHFAVDIESPCHFRTEGTFCHSPIMLSTFSLHVISALREHSVIPPLCYRHWVPMSFPHWGNILSFPHYAVDIQSPCHLHTEGTFCHSPTMLSTFSLHVISALREHSVIPPLCCRHWVSMPMMTSYQFHPREQTYRS